MKKTPISKTELTPDEVVVVAYMHLLRGLEEHDLAALLDLNSGRISEAVTAIRWASENHKMIYRHVAKRKKLAKARAAATSEAPVKMLTDSALWPAGNGHYDGSD